MAHVKYFMDTARHWQLPISIANNILAIWWGTKSFVPMRCMDPTLFELVGMVSLLQYLCVYDTYLVRDFCLTFFSKRVKKAEIVNFRVEMSPFSWLHRLLVEKSAEYTNITSSEHFSAISSLQRWQRNVAQFTYFCTYNTTLFRYLVNAHSLLNL